LVKEWLERSPAEKGLGEVVGSRPNRSQLSSLAAESKPLAGVHQTQDNQPAKRGDHTAVFSVGAASP